MADNSTELGSLNIRITADLSDFEASLKSATAQYETFAKNVKTGFAQPIQSAVTTVNKSAQQIVTAVTVPMKDLTTTVALVGNEVRANLEAPIQEAAKVAAISGAKIETGLVEPLKAVEGQAQSTGLSVEILGAEMQSAFAGMKTSLDKVASTVPIQPVEQFHVSTRGLTGGLRGLSHILHATGFEAAGFATSMASAGIHTLHLKEIVADLWKGLTGLINPLVGIAAIAAGVTYGIYRLGKAMIDASEGVSKLSLEFARLQGQQQREEFYKKGEEAGNRLVEANKKLAETYEKIGEALAVVNDKDASSEKKREAVDSIIKMTEAAAELQRVIQEDRVT